MTRIAIIADVHVANHKRWGGALSGGLNDRARDCCAVLKRCVEKAWQANCQALFVLGDLFHSSKPTPPLVRAVMDALEHTKLRTFVLLGNHDKQSEVGHDHACAPMLDADPTTVISKPWSRMFDDVDVWCVPYTPGEAKDWLTAGLAHLGSKAKTKQGTKRLALSHLGIFDDSTPGYLKTAHDATSISHVRWLGNIHLLDSFAAGNWHEQKLWTGDSQSPTVLIPGTICPASFSDAFPDNSGKLWIYDSVTNVFSQYAIPGPRFEKVDLNRLRGIHERNDPTPGERGWRHYIKATVRRDDYQSAMYFMDKLQAHQHLEVEIDREVDKLSVREAARAANAAAHGDVAQMAAVDLAEVKEPGTKEGVAKRFEAYRKAAL